jgi:prevent-host-death family protein
LRNDYLSISELAQNSGEPIYITKNGEGDIVVMSIDAFERREESIRLKERLDYAEQSRLSGEKAFSVAEAWEEIDKLYDKR